MSTFNDMERPSDERVEQSPTTLGLLLLRFCCMIGSHTWYVVESQAPYGLYGARMDFHKCAACGKRRRVILEWEDRND